MPKENIIKVKIKDRPTQTIEIVRKIFNGLNPNTEEAIVNAVEFPYGPNSNRVNIELEPEVNAELMKSKLKQIEGIALKK